MRPFQFSVGSMVILTPLAVGGCFVLAKVLTVEFRGLALLGWLFLLGFLAVPVVFYPLVIGRAARRKRFATAAIITFVWITTLVIGVMSIVAIEQR